MISGRLTMRAAIERNVSTGTDAWNQPVAPDYQPHAVLPCFAYAKSASDVVDGKKNAIVQDIRIMFALGSDVLATDRVAQITDRKDVVLFAGPFRIEGEIEYRHNHREAALVRVA